MPWGQRQQPSIVIDVSLRHCGRELRPSARRPRPPAGGPRPRGEGPARDGPLLQEFRSSPLPSGDSSWRRPGPSAVAEKVVGHVVYCSVCKHHSLFDP
jgi:hypothetical protein